MIVSGSWCFVTKIFMRSWIALVVAKAVKGGFGGKSHREMGATSRDTPSFILSIC